MSSICRLVRRTTAYYANLSTSFRLWNLRHSEHLQSSSQTYIQPRELTTMIATCASYSMEFESYDIGWIWRTRLRRSITFTVLFVGIQHPQIWKLLIDSSHLCYDALAVRWTTTTHVTEVRTRLCRNFKLCLCWFVSVTETFPTGIVIPPEHILDVPSWRT
jgi:hypothetical protein